MQLLERAGQQALRDLIVGDPQGLEDGLVHEAPHHWGSPQVEVVQVGGGQCQRLVDHRSQLIVGNAEPGDDGLSV